MQLELFKDLTLNLAIFVSSIFFIWIIVNEKTGTITKKKMTLSPIEKMLAGILFGAFGTFIMFYGINVDDGLLVDLRHLSIIMSASFGGLLSSIITGIIIAINRLLLFDGFTIHSYIGALNAINMGIISGLIVLYWKKNNWIYMNLYCVLSITVVYTFLVKNMQILTNTLISFWFLSIVSGYIIFKLINYIKHTSYLQKQIKESLEELQDLKIALDEASIVSITDPNGIITYVNDKFVEISGFSREELIGTTHRIINSGYHTNSFFKDLWETIGSGKIWRGEIRNISKKGQYKWFDSTIVPFIMDGKIYQYVSVRTDVTERKEAVRKMKILSNVDGLTEISNRRYFDYKLEKEWDHSLNVQPLSLILLDIDHFKDYNDTYGHTGGDECLRKVAKKLDEIASIYEYTVARYGGEEFSIILPNTTKEIALLFAEKIRREIEGLAIEHTLSKTKNVVTVSIGVATMIPSTDSRTDDLIKQSDEALYCGKSRGRNQVYFYNNQVVLT